MPASYAPSPEQDAQIKSLIVAGLTPGDIADRMGWCGTRSLRAIQRIKNEMPRRYARGIATHEPGCTKRSRMGNWA